MSWLRNIALATVVVGLGLSACTGSQAGESLSPSAIPTSAATAGLTQSTSTTTAAARPSVPKPSAPQVTTRADQSPKPKAPSSRTQGTSGTKTARPQKSVAGLPTCALADLPSATAGIVAKVKAGGPFEYPNKDGSTFGNFEGLLPKKSRGYYREHTVRTPRVKHRGARRIVTGGKTATAPDWWFYTGDHYKSFCVMTGV